MVSPEVSDHYDPRSSTWKACVCLFVMLYVDLFLIIQCNPVQYHVPFVLVVKMYENVLPVALYPLRSERPALS